MIQRVVIAVVLVGVSCSLYELDLEFLSAVGSANEAILLVLFAQVFVLFFCCTLIEWGSIFLSSFFSSFCQKRKSYFKKQLADSNSIIPSIPPLLAITSNRYATLFMILFSMGSLLTFIINIWLLPLFIKGYFSVSTPLSIEQHIHLMHCL